MNALGPIAVEIDSTVVIVTRVLLHRWLCPSCKRHKVGKGRDTVIVSVPQRVLAALCVGVAHDHAPLGLASVDAHGLVEFESLADQTFKESLVGGLGGAPLALYVKPKGSVLAAIRSEVVYGFLHLRLGRVAGDIRKLR